MLTQRTLRIEGDTGRKVPIVEELSKNKKVYKVQFTVNGLPKLIMYKPTMPYHIIMGIPFRSYNQCLFFKQKVGGLTRNGSCFTLKELKKQRKAKGKKVVDLLEEVNNPVIEEETNEFLKLMKHSEYSVIKQLKKTHARILLLSLILSFEPHSKAL
jgi:hypothetical protein